MQNPFWLQKLGQVFPDIVQNALKSGHFSDPDKAERVFVVPPSEERQVTEYDPMVKTMEVSVQV